jgi:hypothetical protein
VNEREYHRRYRLENAARLSAQRKAHYQANREVIRASQAAYRLKNLEKLRAYDRARRAADPEKRRALNRKYQEKNRAEISAKRKPYFAARKALKAKYDQQYAARNKEYVKARQLAYYKVKKPEFCARVVKRNAQKSLAMPKWANEFFISEAYDLAERRTKATGYRWHVDHIVPLQNALVCGLHVEHNLQVIPAVRNLAKGNRYWPDMP